MFLNDNGAYIKRELVEELINFLIEKNEIPDIEYKIFRNVMFKDTSYGCGNDDETNTSLFDSIIIPRALVIDDDMEQEVFILDYQKKYGLDYKEFMKEYEINFWQMQCIFSLLHEMGHIIDVKNDLELHGRLSNNEEDEEEMKKLMATYIFMEEEEVWSRYRNIRGEIVADRNAVRLLIKYTDKLVDIVKRGIIICSEYELVELDRQSKENSCCTW